MSQAPRAKMITTQERLEDKLSDGKPHTSLQLRQMLGLGDDKTDVMNLNVHISNLRKKLRPEGKAILCTQDRSGEKTVTNFQLVHLTKL